MKTFIIFIFHFFAFAQDETPLDLRLPSMRETRSLASQALQKMDAVNKHSGLGCNKIKYIVTPEGELQREYMCFVPNENLKKWLIAAQDKVSSEVEQSNDANPLQIRNENKVGQNMSDDVGYTLGANLEYMRQNREREWKVKLGTSLYSARVKDANGNSRNNENKLYLETLEVMKLDVSGKMASGDPSIQVVGQAGLRYETSRGNGIGVKIQEEWHSQTRYQNLRYAYVDGKKTELSAEAQVGLEKLMKAELGDFRCFTSGLTMVGASTTGQTLVTVQAKAQVSTGTLGGRNEDTPYLTLSHMLNQEFRGRELNREQRTEIGSYVFAGKEYALYLSGGRLRIKNPDNTEYTQRAPNGEEKIYYFRIRAEKSFQGL